MLLRLRTQLSTEEYYCSCSRANYSTLIYNTRLFMILCKKMKMQTFHLYEALVVLFLYRHTFTFNRATENMFEQEVRQIYGKVWKFGYYSCSATHILKDFLSVKNKLWKQKTKSFGSKTSCFKVLEYNTLDMQLMRIWEVFLWIGKKNTTKKNNVQII